MLNIIIMIIKHIQKTTDVIHYWYYTTPTAERMTMKSFHYVWSWMPDIKNNVVHISDLIESYNDFTYKEFLTEILMLITEYQDAVKDGWMSQRVFEMKIKNFNYHLTKNNINITINI